MNRLKEAINIPEGHNLNKENFWNIAEGIYPNVIKLFYTWIDGYKKLFFSIPEYNRSLNWDAFFGNIWPTAHPIKFHHIPMEMQVGIIYRFFNELAGTPEYEMIRTIPHNYLSHDGWIHTICDLFYICEALVIDMQKFQRICPNCKEQATIREGNTMCNKCVAELYDENK